MTSFYRLNKKLKTPAYIEDGLIFGRVGFSFSQQTLEALIGSLSNYILHKPVDRINIATDGSYWASTLAEELLIPGFEFFGVKVTKIDKPVPVMQLAWLSTQSGKNKTISLYVGRDSHLEEYLSFLLFNEEGHPLEKSEILKALKHHKIKFTQEFNTFKDRQVEFIDTSAYLKFLYDTKRLPKLNSSTTLHIDCMFGCYDKLFTVLKRIPDLSLHIYNKQSEAPRLLNYLPKPTGKFLSWYTNYKGVNPGDYFFAVDSDGDSIGAFDLKQKTEISSGGIALILIKYLVEVRSIENLKVLYSPACGSKIKDFCKKLKVESVEVYNYFQGVIDHRKSEKDSFIFYADELGRFYFNEEYVCSNTLLTMFYLIDLCKIKNLSIGEVLDSIYLETLKKKYYHNNIFILREITSVAEVLAALEKHCFKIKSKNGITLATSDKTKTRVCIKDSVKEGIIEVFIETKTAEELKEVTESLNSILKEYTDERSVE